VSGLHPEEQLIEELRLLFRITYSGMDTEFRMAEELIGLAKELDRLEAENKALRDDRHHAFYRQQRRP
jgi:coproporphyrinogen III oxidase-like Fe-S oxidoreductase